MARFRLSAPAKADLAAILGRSERLHGIDARYRYRACLTAAMRRIAADPSGSSTITRGSLGQGVRSFHIRHSRHESLETTVAEPAHLLFYRVLQPGLVEIVRVLHERMEPSRHLEPVSGKTG